ncbi:MAG: hypothetical protein HRT87_09590, partial [Legionellales bacterium]|nr:hypothetical protein [Legionellales bacterium]
IISAIINTDLSPNEVINKKIFTRSEVIHNLTINGQSRKDLTKKGFATNTLTNQEIFPKQPGNFLGYPVIYLTSNKAKDILIYQQLFKTATGSKLVDTPHYDFVTKSLHATQVPSNTDYHTFIKDYEGTRDHSPKKYYANIKNWQKNGLDTEKYPIQVYEKQLHGKKYYGVYDGAHRAAFAIATNQGIKLYIKPQSAWQGLWYRKPMAKPITNIHPFNFNNLAKNGYNDKLAWN